jgi:hypothetical protein
MTLYRPTERAGLSEQSPNKPRLLKNLWAREAGAHTVPQPTCDCVVPRHDAKWSELQIHIEAQDTECSAWQRLNELIDDAARDGRHEFSPGPEMTPGLNRPGIVGGWLV